MEKNKYIIIISILSFIFSFGFVYIKMNNIIWSNNVQISAAIKGFGLKQSLALNPDNSISFTWQQSIGDPDSKLSEIYYCEHSNGNLTKAENISNTSAASLNPVTIYDNEGTIHAVWEERDLPSLDIFYAYKKNGVWSKPVSIFHNDSSVYAVHGIVLKLRCDKYNNIYLMWNLYDKIFYKIYIGIIKDSKITNTKMFKYEFCYYDFLIDENHIIHLAGIGPFLSGEKTDLNSVLYTCSADSGETWTNRVLVNKSGIYPAYGIRILKDGNSTLHIIWGKDRKGKQAPDCIYHSTSTDGNNWPLPKVIGGNSGGYVLYDPIVEVDSKNHLHLFWTWTKTFISLPFQLNYSFYDGNNWTEPISIKENASNPEICIDTKDILYMIYFDQLNSVSPEYIVTWFYMHSVNPVTKIKIEDITPVKYILNQNYPNPFNPSTVLSFELRVSGYVTLKVYDVLGREIRTLVNEHKEAGKHNISFDAEDLAAGTYFYRLIVQPSDGSRTITLSRSMQVIK